MAKDFYTAVKQRRTCYALSKETTIPDERIQELIKNAVKYTPSAFNSQSGGYKLFAKNIINLEEQKALRKVVAKRIPLPKKNKLLPVDTVCFVL